MKKSLMMFVLILSVNIASAEVMITQVLYDPDGTDTGREWVELYNPHDYDISLEGYSLETGNGAEANDWTVEWNGTETIFSQGYFLIGESDVIVEPDFVAALDLQNGPDAVRLLKDSSPIDTIGWGELLFSEYYDGTPSPEAASGDALQRIYTLDGPLRLYSSTGDNLFDFESAFPAPKNSGSGSFIDIEVDVKEDFIMISNITIDSVSEAHIIPKPGKNSSVEVTALIQNPSGTDSMAVTIDFNDIQTDMALSEELSPNEGIFAGAITVPYYMAPDNYTIVISADKDGITGTSNQTFEVMPLAALDIDTSSLKFENAAKGAFSSIYGDESMSTLDRPTVKNIGNRDIDLMLSGTDLVSSGNTINISLVSYEFPGPVQGEISREASLIPLNLGIMGTSPMSFSMYVPDAQTSGRYRGTLIVSAVSSG